MRQRGFGLVEIVIAAALISVSIFSLSFVFVLAQRAESQSTHKAQAIFLAEEGVEVMRFLRDTSWLANIAPLEEGTDYYLSFQDATSEWSIGETDPGFVDGIFSQIITVEPVYRDAQDDIVSSGGLLDPDSKLIVSTTSWSEQKTTSLVQLRAYLSDIFKN